MEFEWAKGDLIVVDGVEVARADRSWLRERAEVQIGPELWHYRAEGGWGRSTLVAELDGTARFTARRSGVFSTTWTVDAGTQLQVVQAGWFGSRLNVTRNGTPIGEVTHSGIFSARPRLQLTEPLETRAGCFVLWVAHVEFSRQASSSAGASSGATG